MTWINQYVQKIVKRNENRWGFLKLLRRNMVTKIEGEKVQNIKTVEKLLEKYKHLRKEDQIKLIQNQLRELAKRDVKEIYDFVQKKEQVAAISDEYEKRRKSKIWKLRKPAYLQQKSIKRKVGEELGVNEYNDNICIQKEKELGEIEKYTLIEDLYKAYIYGKSFMLLQNQYMTVHKISNDFIYVMINTIRQNILEKIKPTLINEFGVYKNPFMLFKNALFNFILYEFVKNPYEETLIEDYINKNIQLNILKLNSASVPAEVFEPLVAFRGDTLYNFDLKERFADSVNTSLNIINLLKKQETLTVQSGNDNDKNPFGQEIKQLEPTEQQRRQKEKGQETGKDDEMNFINEVLKMLPENQKYHFDNYPFENLKSFKTNIRKKYVGGIKNNKPLNIDEEELLDMRYPNLQCVAHSLPKDVKYRDNVIHAIKVLERSKYWDHKSKIKAVSMLIEVWNNMCSSEHYENVLDRALPAIYTQDMLKKTKTRRDAYNKGLKYIQSLTTQKPLSARLKK